MQIRETHVRDACWLLCCRVTLHRVLSPVQTLRFVMEAYPTRPGAPLQGSAILPHLPSVEPACMPSLSHSTGGNPWGSRVGFRDRTLNPNSCAMLRRRAGAGKQRGAQAGTRDGGLPQGGGAAQGRLRRGRGRRAQGALLPAGFSCLQFSLLFRRQLTMAHHLRSFSSDPALEAD